MTKQQYFKTVDPRPHRDPICSYDLHQQNQRRIRRQNERNNTCWRGWY